MHLNESFIQTDFHGVHFINPSETKKEVEACSHENVFTVILHFNDYLKEDLLK
jgi:hypothetical protein